MPSLKELKEDRDELLKAAETIQQSVEKESRDYTDDENKQLDAILSDGGKVDLLNIEIAKEEKRDSYLKRVARERRSQRSGDELSQRTSGAYPHETPTRSSMPQFRDAKTGQTIRVFASKERIADHSAHDGQFGDEPPPRVGEVLADLLTGKNQYCSATQLSSAIGSSDSAGGHLLVPSMSSQVIDLARSASVALRAGALTLPLDTAEHVVATVESDPTAHWRAEGVEVPSSDVTFGRITLRPRTLAAIVPVSIELLEDASNSAQIIESSLQAALGLKLDQAVLFGSGAESEPRGITNQTGINTVESVGTPADYSEVSSAIGNIYQANYPGEPSDLAWIYNPREGETYDGLVSSGAGADGQPLQPTPWAAALQRYMTTSLSITEGGGSESSMIVGHFPQCVIGMRTTGVNIRIAADGTVSDGTKNYNATSQLMRHIVAYIRADVALYRPSWFTVLSGVTNS